MYKNKVAEFRFLYSSGFQKKKGTTPTLRNNPKTNGIQILKYCAENNWYQEKVKK